MEALKRQKNDKLLEQGFPLISTCWKLLNSIAEKGDVNTLNEAFTVLTENKYIAPNNILLGPLIKVHFVKWVLIILSFI